MNTPANTTVSTLSKKVVYFSHFTPSMMPPETLEAMLVQREPTLSRCLDYVVESLKTGSSHHTLFVGPRGIGKTHLISLLHHRLTKTQEAQNKALIAWMREEEWGVTSFFELVLRILRTLDASYPQFNIEKRTSPIYDMSIAEAEKQAESLLLEVLGEKRLVVFLENLDDLFEQLGDQGQKAWRAFIQNHNNMILVCTTPSLFAGVSLQKSAFYGFFDIEPLTELSFEEVVLLLEKIATERGDQDLAEFILTPEGRSRIRAVHHLAEGNPRIYIIFAQFLSRETLDELVQAFMHTLDELTPYYQARMKELSGQQRKIVEYLVNYRGAAAVKQIAKSCFITQQTCSSQLKQLKQKRYVRAIEQGRESYYELCEPLMRLCMEVKKQRGEPVGLFVEMLRIWYTEDQLKALLDGPAQNCSLDAAYLNKALLLLQTETLEPTVKAILKDMSTFPKNLDKKPILREFAELTTKDVQIQQLQSMIRLGVPELYSVGELSDDQILRDSLNTTAFATDFLTNNKKTNNINEPLTSLFSISIILLKYNKTYNKPLLEALIPAILKFPSLSAIAIIKASLANDPTNKDWFIELKNTHSKELTSRKLIFFFKKLNRIITALHGSLTSNNPLILLKLSKEERSLVESMVSNSANARKSSSPS
ncbi:MAG: AAA family ATPase [Polaromonas sp.]|nr:AAA family ATPase [Polaromonas sp.]